MEKSMQDIANTLNGTIVSVDHGTEQEIVVVVTVEEDSTNDKNGEEAGTSKGESDTAPRKHEVVVGSVCLKPVMKMEAEEKKEETEDKLPMSVRCSKPAMKMKRESNPWVDPEPTKGEEIDSLMGLSPAELADVIRRRNHARDRQRRRLLKKKKEAEANGWLDKNGDIKPVRLPPPPKPKKTHACPTCGNVFRTASKLRRHQISFLRDEGMTCLKRKLKLGYYCTFCQYSCKKRYNLYRHIQRNHPEQAEAAGIKIKEPPKVDRQMICGVCHKTFTTASNLKRHTRTHTGERPYECFCGKTFSDSSHLTTHLKLHTDEKQYECSVCAKKFFRKLHLEGHMRIHSKEKPFQCDVCEKRFARKDYLASHKHIHRDASEKSPYSCPVCGRGFNNAGNRNKHVKLHNTEKNVVSPAISKTISETDHEAVKASVAAQVTVNQSNQDIVNTMEVVLKEESKT